MTWPRANRIRQGHVACQDAKRSIVEGWEQATPSEVRVRSGVFRMLGEVVIPCPAEGLKPDFACILGLEGPGGISRFGARCGAGAASSARVSEHRFELLERQGAPWSAHGAVEAVRVREEDRARV